MKIDTKWPALKLVSTLSFIKKSQLTRHVLLVENFPESVRIAILFCSYALNILFFQFFCTGFPPAYARLIGHYPSVAPLIGHYQPLASNALLQYSTSLESFINLLKYKLKRNLMNFFWRKIVEEGLMQTAGNDQWEGRPMGSGQWEGRKSREDPSTKQLKK